MTDTSATPAAGSSLKQHAVGVPGIVFFVVAAAAPLAATLGASPIAFMATGTGAPGAYLITGLVLLLFAVGYSAMSRHVTSSAGFAAFLEVAFGRRAGFAGAAVALVAYNAMLMGLYGAFGFFTSTVVADLTGAETDWKLWTIGAWALVAVLGYLEVNLSARVLGVLMVGEIVILVIFAVVVFTDGGADGINVDSFQPSNVFTNGLGVALLFAAASFVGFEATAIYGEEAKDPERTIPRATYVAVVLIAVFYTFATWAISLAYGSDKIGQAATKDPAGFIFAANSQYVGEWSTNIMNVLLVTSYFAVLLAFHNTLSRYMFALGRAGMLPSLLGRTHSRWRSPHTASVAGTVVTLVIVGAFMVGDADPFGQLYAWLVGLGTLGVLVLQGLTAVAVITFFLRRERAQLRVWNCVIAPGLGALGLGVAAYLALDNWDLLTGATEGLPALLPWLLPIAAVGGLVWSLIVNDKNTSLLTAFGANRADESRAVVSGLGAPHLPE